MSERVIGRQWLLSNVRLHVARGEGVGPVVFDSTTSMVRFDGQSTAEENVQQPLGSKGVLNSGWPALAGLSWHFDELYTLVSLSKHLSLISLVIASS